MRDKMEEMADLVQTNLEQAVARQRNLQLGQKVLLLITTSEKSFLPGGKGPMRWCRRWVQLLQIQLLRSTFLGPGRPLMSIF